MLLDSETLRGVAEGRISLAFRRWRRPTVKPGGTLLTAIGQLAIDAVERVDVEAITRREAAAAGFASRESLLEELARRSVGDVYRIRLTLAGPDPRIALRSEVPRGAALEALIVRLERLDSRAPFGAWTRAALEAIARRPGVRAADLAADLRQETAAFKVRVRKLKAQGLTESLDVGYRLSPRGEAVLRRIRRTSS